MFEQYGSERRKFVRVNGNVKVTYTVLSAEIEKAYHDEIESMYNNISAGGICFVAKEELLPGTLLRLEILLPGASESIQAFGKVVWQQHLEEKQYKTGVAFFWIVKEDRDSIIFYAEKRKTEED